MKTKTQITILIIILFFTIPSCDLDDHYYGDGLNVKIVLLNSNKNDNLRIKVVIKNDLNYDIFINNMNLFPKILKSIYFFSREIKAENILPTAIQIDSIDIRHSFNVTPLENSFFDTLIMKNSDLCEQYNFSDDAIKSIFSQYYMSRLYIKRGESLNYEIILNAIDFLSGSYKIFLENPTTSSKEFIENMFDRFELKNDTVSNGYKLWDGKFVSNSVTIEID